MISQVPRQLEFGNPAHIARVDEWQALNDAEREMLLDEAKSWLDENRAEIIQPKAEET